MVNTSTNRFFKDKRHILDILNGYLDINFSVYLVNQLQQKYRLLKPCERAIAPNFTIVRNTFAQRNTEKPISIKTQRKQVFLRSIFPKNEMIINSMWKNNYYNLFKNAI